MISRFFARIGVFKIDCLDLLSDFDLLLSLDFEVLFLDRIESLLAGVIRDGSAMTLFLLPRFGTEIVFLFFFAADIVFRLFAF